MHEIIDQMSRTSEVIREAIAEIGRLQERIRLADKAVMELTAANIQQKIRNDFLEKQRGAQIKDIPVSNYDRGGTGHGDESYSDADSGL